MTATASNQSVGNWAPTSETCWQRRGRRLALLLGLAAWVALVRHHTFLDLATDNDESFYLLVGKIWNEGGLPYLTVWDVKPPGLFALFALAEQLFGPSILAARLLTAAAVLASALLLYRFARNHLAPADGDRRGAGRDWVPLGAALIYPAYSVAMFGSRSRAELLLAPFVIGALDLVFLWRRQRHDPDRTGLTAPVGAGLMFGMAIMIKQTAGFEMLMAVVVLAVRPGWREAAWRARRSDGAVSALFAGMAALPALGFIVYFAARGVPFDLYFTPFLGAAHRLGGDGVSFTQGLYRLLPLQKPVLPLLAGALILAVERRRIAVLCRDRDAILLLYGWLVAALLAVIAMRAMYVGYLLPLVPPLLLLTLVALRLIGRQRLVIGTLALLIGLYPYGWLRWQEDDIADVNALPAAAAARLASDGLTPSGSLYVFDGEPTLYLLTGTQPLTRYAFPQHLICDFTIPAGSQMAEIDRILSERPTYIVTARRSMICELADRTARVNQALNAGYRLLDRLSTDEQELDLYRLDSDPAAHR